MKKILLAAIFLVAMGAMSFGQTGHIKASCVPDLKFETQENLVFSYTFKLTDRGILYDLRNTKGKSLASDDGKFKSCLSQWQATGLPFDRGYTAYLTWKTGVGWIKPAVYSYPRTKVRVQYTSKKLPGAQSQAPLKS